jgi:hypothetical protein
MPLNFDLVQVNPNDITGGGGSLAGPTGDADATGPYFIWPNQEYESYISPYAVVAASEVRAMAALLDQYEAGGVEPLAGGERDTPDPVELQPVGQVPVDIVPPEFDPYDAESFKRAAEFARGED